MCFTGTWNVWLTTARREHWWLSQKPGCRTECHQMKCHGYKLSLMDKMHHGQNVAWQNITGKNDTWTICRGENLTGKNVNRQNRTNRQRWRISKNCIVDWQTIFAKIPRSSWVGVWCMCYSCHFPAAINTCPVSQPFLELFYKRRQVKLNNIGIKTEPWTVQ